MAAVVVLLVVVAVVDNGGGAGPAVVVAPEQQARTKQEQVRWAARVLAAARDDLLEAAEWGDEVELCLVLEAGGVLPP